MTSAEFRARLTARLGGGIAAVTADVIERIEIYYRLLATWNKRINLTAFNLDDLSTEAVDRLFVEPILAAHYAPAGRRVLDVGSGGGSPAIPFALAAQASALTMVESRARKSVFLKEAARAVALPGTVLTDRFETVAASPHLAQQFDLITVRAVRIENDDWARFGALLNGTGSLFLLHQLGASVSPRDGFAPAEVHPLTEKAQLSIYVRV